jgi:monoamine oxidase
MYDVIIVGGGLAGLYTAYKLPKHLNILILEKYTLGGKVDTYHDAVMTVECGAARFSKKHVLLMQLLRDFGLANRMKPIPSDDPTFLTTKGTPTFSMKALWNRLKKCKAPKTIHTSLGAYAQSVLTEEEYDFLVGSFGYSAEFDIMNVADALRLMEEYTQDFYVLGGGLSQLVHRLVQELRHVEFKKDHVTNVRYANEFFSVTSKTGMVYEGQTCVMSMPRSALEKFSICRPLKPKLDLIKTSPLCRIYAQCPTGMFTTKITTDNDLKYVIPITKNVVLASYTDSKYATRWNSIFEQGGVREVSKKLTADFAEIGMKPGLKHVKVFYWPDGVGYWGVGADSIKLEKELLHPYPGTPLYVCGENYSHTHQQWMEGALNTANKVAHLIYPMKK